MSLPGGPVRVAIANMKGGVGKSTTVMMLADAMALYHGLQVLVVDLDPQANSGQMLLGFAGLQAAQAAGKTLTHWVESQTLPQSAAFFSCVMPAVCGLQEVRNGTRANSASPKPGQVGLLASTPRLRFAELTFDHAFYKSTNRAAPREAMVERLQKGLRSLGKAYDVIIFDCPPGFTTLAQAALSVSDGIISPILEDPVSLWSLKDFREFGLVGELNVWDRDRHRVLYARVSEKGAPNERAQFRQDVLLAGFDAFSTSIKDAVQALRWTQRTATDNYRTITEKYAALRVPVRELAADTVAFLSSLNRRTP